MMKERGLSWCSAIESSGHATIVECVIASVNSHYS